MIGDLSDQAFRAELHKRGWNDLEAGARTEAQVYTLYNPYLSPMQKAQVEAVYQFPLGAFEYALIAMLLIDGPSGWLKAYLVACVVSLLVWPVSWFMAGRFTVVAGTLFAGRFATIGCLALGSFSIYQGQYAVAAIAATMTFIPLVIVVAPPMWLFSLCSKGLDARYALAKKMWGIEFPFEKYLRRPQ